MSMIDDFAVTTVGWATIASRDGYGDITYNAATNIKAKVEYSEKMFKSPRDGTTRVSNVQIYANSTYGFLIDQLVTVDSVEYIIELVKSHDMFEVPDHKECLLVTSEPDS
jgi:hypothetical protein